MARLKWQACGQFLDGSAAAVLYRKLMVGEEGGGVAVWRSLRAVPRQSENT